MKKDILINKYMMIMFKTKRLLHKLKVIPEKHSPATSLQFQALHILHKDPNIKVGELADHLSMSSASIAQLTDRLVSMKWIKKTSDSTDKRINRLALTRNGESEIKNIKAKAISSMKKVFSMTPQNDLEELIRIQSDILSNLEKISKND